MAVKTATTIYWTRLNVKDWILFIASSSKGLCYVGSANRPFEELKDWTKFRYGACQLVQDDERMKSYVSEMTEYMLGTRTTFTIPFDLQGTSFQRSVWEALRSIPYGETWTYSDIAHQIDRPDAVRAVGAAIGANPALIVVPCHRVVGKNGSLTGFRGGLPMKRRLLELEQQKF